MDYHIPLIVCAFMALDVVSGIVKGWSQKALSSTKLRKGLGNKMGFIIMLVLAYACEYAMGYLDLGFTIPLVPAVSVYICLTEVVSICENVAIINPDLQQSALFQLFDVGGGEDED